MMLPSQPLFDSETPSVAWALVATACVANFIDRFESFMILSALPFVRTELQLDLMELDWAVLAYSQL